jgi:methionyl-tRNA synthetase
MVMDKKYYVTTPIYYVNDAPHIGSAYTTLAADIIARYYRQKLGRENVFFLTGTDEHGQKVQTVAEEKGLTPIQLADKVAGEFKDAWKLLNIDYDFFIRTTDPRHEKVVCDFLQKLYDAGYIYSGTYEGPYCVGCERYYKESELVNGRCPLHPNKEISHQKEKNYFLKLKDLVQDKVLPKLKSGEYNILPEERKNEILSRIEQGVEDVSVSREGVSWGIPLPWDKTQTAYVWIEALINYYSATKFLEGKENFWPADVHFMAKDILWFHAVIWEALLLAADLPLPKNVFAHGFFTIDGQKMSKSLGNVITPKQLVEKYGVDGARYLMISAVTFGSDGDISLKSFDVKFNADLANGLGNAVARIGKLSEKVDDFSDYKLKSSEEYVKDIETFKLDQVVEIIRTEIRDLDGYINKTEPWTITDNSKLKEVLQICVDRIRQIAFELKPFMPETSEKIEEQFKGPKIKSSDPLFPRLK